MSYRRWQAGTELATRHLTSFSHLITTSPSTSLLPQRRTVSTSSSSSSSPSTMDLPSSPFPIYTHIEGYRRWRRHVQRAAILSTASLRPSTGSASTAEQDPSEAEDEAGSVGFVPTMGALHAGHLNLVRHSLRENKHTVVSIFVNPAQFAPTEDLASYPRTLKGDLLALESLEKQVLAEKDGQEEKVGRISAIFCPDSREMYPPLPGTQTPFTQHVAKQQGAFIEVQGLSNVLEGKSRPGFFRGVATVVTKLWHVVEPTRVYFGQKDIQQAIILRALLTSLLFQSPSSSSSSSSFRVIPTSRDPNTGLALSSRNAYLGEGGKRWAPTLYRALRLAKKTFQDALQAESSTTAPSSSSVAQAAKKAKQEAEETIRSADLQAQTEDPAVRLELDYISFNSSATLTELGAKEESGELEDGKMEKDEELGAILSGAMWVIEGHQRTRMIDNLLIGSAQKLLG